MPTLSFHQFVWTTGRDDKHLPLKIDPDRALIDQIVELFEQIGPRHFDTIIMPPHGTAAILILQIWTAVMGELPDVRSPGGNKGALGPGSQLSMEQYLRYAQELTEPLFPVVESVATMQPKVCIVVDGWGYGNGLSQDQREWLAKKVDCQELFVVRSTNGTVDLSNPAPGMVKHTLTVGVSRDSSHTYLYDPAQYSIVAALEAATIRALVGEWPVLIHYAKTGLELFHPKDLHQIGVKT